MRDDLTVVYFTSNLEDQGFEAKVRSTIISSCRGLPIVSVSQQPLEFGHNICIGDVGASPPNILRHVSAPFCPAPDSWSCARPTVCTRHPTSPSNLPETT